MTYRPEYEKQGFTEVWYRDGSKRHIRREDFEGLETAMREGAEFFEATSLQDGSTGLIRVSAVLEIWAVSAELVRISDENAEAEAQYKKTHGED